MSGALRRERLRRRLLRARRPADRRGVLLLVVLSMLVLFLLVGTTFLITSGQYRTQSKVVEKANRSTFQPADLLERALMQLVRDTNNPSSVVRYHSLLRDLYGVDGFEGRVMLDGTVTKEAGLGYINYGSVTNEPIAPRYAGVDIRQTISNTNPALGPTQGQVIEFYVADVEDLNLGDAALFADHNTVGLDFDADGLPIAHRLAATDGHYDGCLLTFLDGPCRGETTRVLSYELVYSTLRTTLGDNTRITVTRWRVMTPRRADGQPLRLGSLPLTADDTGLIDLAESQELGHRFIVNGRPFNGAGVGYNPLALSHDVTSGVPAPRLSALEFIETIGGGGAGYGMERALIPNPVQYFERANVALNPSAGTDPWSNPNTPGGAYAGNEFIPLTRGFVSPDPNNPSYNPDINTPLYSGFAGPGDTDESYDAPDHQNMALASQALEPRMRGRVVSSNSTGSLVAGSSYDPDTYYAEINTPPAYLDLEGVTIPSFHRPALANFWFHRLFNSQWLSGITPDERVRAILQPFNENGVAQHGLSEENAKAITEIKRRFLLRPLREDHPDFDGSNPLSRYATNALRNALDGGTLVNDRQTPTDPTDDEITFPYWEAVGPWDVDNDGDGVPDSVWVDIGLPVQQTEDGRWYKPLVAMLVEDLDGRLNLNAHGSEEHLTENFLDASTRGGVTLEQNLAQDYSLNSSLFTSDQLSEGAGWGVAETSLRPVLSPTLPLDNTLNSTLPNTGPGTFQGDAQYDDYARLLQGRPDPTLATPARAVTEALRGSIPFGRYGTGFVTGLTSTDQFGNPIDVRLTSPGRTVVTQQSAGVEPRVPGTRDPRTPLEFLGYPEFLGRYEQASGFSTAPDLSGRYTGALSAAGVPVRESGSDRILSVNNGAVIETLDDSPYELDLSVAARRLAPVSAETVRLSYDPDLNGVVDSVSAPLVDDAPFSPAELERLLRAFDADANKLPDRLWEIVDAFNPEKLAAAQSLANTQSIASLMRAGATGPINNNGFNASSLDTVVAEAKAAINRRVVTTESFDLPTPNENWTERIVLGADGLPGVPRDNPATNPANEADDDGDLLVNEGDEAVIGYNAAEAHTFIGTATAIDYDDLFLAGCDDYVVVMREDPPATPRITDYLRYRIVLELKREALFAIDTPASDEDLLAAVNRIISGDNRLPSGAAERLALRHSFGGLLAPELMAGVRMDLNRPWGDGRDNGDGIDSDNNGVIDDENELGVDPFMNGVVDEPGEAGEPYVDRNANGVWDSGEPYRDLDGDNQFDPALDRLWENDANTDGTLSFGEFTPFNYTRGADANGGGSYIDSNNSGAYDPGEPRVRDDARLARQLYARHLYCLMLLLVDENYLAPYDSGDLQVRQYLDPDMPSGVAQRIAERLTNNPPATYPLPHQTGVPRIDAREIALRKLTRRRIAQWAINVVDFRDPDAIQTPFEYDENPWDGWNIVDNASGVVLPLDGDLSTDESLGQFREISGAGFSAVAGPTAGLSPLDNTRGVVWGAERPEVLLTEGLAWHDRKLEDAEINLNPSSSNPAPEEYDGGLVTDEDDDLDQIRVPRGYTFLEALNPWLNDQQRPAEFYSFVDPDTGQVTLQEGVRFDRLTNTPFLDPATGNVVRSPIWRIICVEENPLLRNASQGATTASGPGGGGSPLLAELALTDDPPANGQPFYQKGPWQYDEFRSPFIGTTHKYAALIDDKTEEYTAAIRLTQVGDILNGLTDADGLIVATGVREIPQLTPDPSWPTFDRLQQPEHIVNGTSDTFPIDISSTIDGKLKGTGGSGSDRQVDRFRFSKPIRYIERAAYMVTADPADGRVTGSSSGPIGSPNLQPLANVEPTDPNQQYDPSGFRVPTLRFQVPYAPVKSSEVQNWWQYSASKASKGFWVNANRFASFDWFNQFDDPAVTDAKLERLDPIRLAPLLPGRRAVIGTQGGIYENAEERGYFDTADPTDPLGPRFLTGRYTTIVSGDGQWNASSGASSSPAAGYWRFEMIPSPEPNEHQFAVRMNGRTESITVYDNAGAPQNVTVSPALTPGNNIDSAVPPVIAVPLDNFSISEPLDRYLMRINELNHNTVATAEFERVWNKSQVAGDTSIRETTGKPWEPDEIAEGYFQRGTSAKGFDEPFDTEPELIENQTTPNYRSVHLERLANPLLPWNPPPYIPATFTSAGGSITSKTAVDYHDPTLPVNPYLPVDSMPVDLTALNSQGEEINVGQPSTNDYVTDSASQPTSTTAGPEALHRKIRELPTGTPTSPMVFDSNERGRPWGNFRTLWTTALDRLLWRQSRPSTTSELVRGGKNVRTKATEEQVYTAAPNEARPITNGGSASGGTGVGGGGGRIPPQAANPDDVTAPGYDYGFELEQLGEKPVGLVLNFGWRMTLGFPEARMGRFYTGTWLNTGPYDEAAGDMLWANLIPRVANAYSIDLDGDSSGLDLLASVEVVDDLLGNLFEDVRDIPNKLPVPNGRPDIIEIIDWDINRDGVVDRHEEAQNPLRQRATTPELAWPNRPFASSGELLQVPAWGGSRMLTYFSAYNWLHTQAPEFLAQTQINPYNGEAAVFHDGKDYNPLDLSNRGNTALDADFANDSYPHGTDPTFDAGTNTRIRSPITGDTFPHRDADPFLEEASTNDLRFRETLGHFGHLMNFFQTARFPSQTGYIERFVDTIDGNGDITQAPNPEQYLAPVGAAHFYRLLDYVHVPSRFVGTDTLLNADVFASEGEDPADPRAALAAPFNRVNRFREPGRVNLNTIVGRRDAVEAADRWSEVYDGLMHRQQDASVIDYNNGDLLKMGHLGPAWRDVALSRRGYVQSSFNPTADATNGLADPGQRLLDYSPRRMHPAFPTFYANPFRAPGEGANVPLAHMVQTGVDATLLRAHPLSPGADSAWGQRGVDDATVDKSGDATADPDGVRDDAGEAGAFTLQLGVDSTSMTQSTIDRLSADVVLARFQNANGRRGALPDSLLADALRPTPQAVDPRSLTPQESRDNSIPNVEIGKRATPVPLFSGATLEPSLDTERNATTRFSPIQRMSSLSTTRSNCYAVWITVGFFEVKPAREDARVWGRYMQADASDPTLGGAFLGADQEEQEATRDEFFSVYPEGWTLGQELNLDTGQNRRHRGFYLVDRTRPVAFRPGEDANVSDTILLRRRIE